MFYTYILRNDVTDRYYVGFSTDLKKRLQSHLSGEVLSTKSDLHYKLEWYCAFQDQKQALSFERYLKSGSGIAFMKKTLFQIKNCSFNERY